MIALLTRVFLDADFYYSALYIYHGTPLGLRKFLLINPLLALRDFPYIFLSSFVLVILSPPPPSLFFVSLIIVCFGVDMFLLILLVGFFVHRGSGYLFPYTGLFSSYFFK